MNTLVEYLNQNAPDKAFIGLLRRKVKHHSTKNMILKIIRLI